MAILYQNIVAMKSIASEALGPKLECGFYALIGDVWCNLARIRSSILSQNWLQNYCNAVSVYNLFRAGLNFLYVI